MKSLSRTFIQTLLKSESEELLTWNCLFFCSNDVVLSVILYFCCFSDSPLILMTSSQMENSLCCLAANVFDRSSEERNQNLWYFFFSLSAEKASAEGKACLSNSISCSELHSHNQASFVLSFTSWSWYSWGHMLASSVLQGCKPRR